MDTYDGTYDTSLDDVDFDEPHISGGYGEIERRPGYTIGTTYGYGDYTGSDIDHDNMGYGERLTRDEEYQDISHIPDDRYAEDQRHFESTKGQKVIESIGRNVTLRRVKTVAILGAFAVLPNYVHEWAEYRDTPGTFMDYSKLFETPLENIDPLVDFLKKIKNIVT